MTTTTLPEPVRARQLAESRLKTAALGFSRGVGKLDELIEAAHAYSSECRQQPEALAQRERPRLRYDFKPLSYEGRRSDTNELLHIARDGQAWRIAATPTGAVRHLLEDALRSRSRAALLTPQFYRHHADRLAAREWTFTLDELRTWASAQG